MSPHLRSFAQPAEPPSAGRLEESHVARPASNGAAEPATVDVCICTYRRPQVVEAIQSVAKQALPPNVQVRLVIADNSAEASARDLVASLAEDFPLRLHYLHAPGANISIARNACLDYAKAGG